LQETRLRSNPIHIIKCFIFFIFSILFILFYVITLKAIKGEHNKDIKIKQQDGDELTLFNGNSFKDDTGYYQNGKWHQGTPDDVKQNK
jgi:hypothetical protein